jgi:hypothetical protein
MYYAPQAIVKSEQKMANIHMTACSFHDSALKLVQKSGCSGVLRSLRGLFHCLLLRLKDVMVNFKNFKGWKDREFRRGSELCGSGRGRA